MSEWTVKPEGNCPNYPPATAVPEARLEELAYRSVPARIAAVLLRLSEGRSGEPVLITHQELGDMIGALHESVTKVLDDFQRAELVELSRGRIILRDVVGLQSRLFCTMERACLHQPC